MIIVIIDISIYIYIHIMEDLNGPFSPDLPDRQACALSRGDN